MLKRVGFVDGLQSPATIGWSFKAWQHGEPNLDQESYCCDELASKVEWCSCPDGFKFTVSGAKI